MALNQENNLMETYKNFNLPEVTAETDFSNEELADDMAGLQLNFQRVKIPSGGALQFELPGEDPENPDYAKTIEGIILFNHASGAYWAEGSEYDDDTAPLCFSSDGILGIGNPGGSCTDCPLNAWGTGANGRGKACKNMRTLYLLPDGQYMPIELKLPPTSIRPFTDFYNIAFASRRRASFGSVVQIGLKRMNNGKDDYSVATFKKVYDFSGEQLVQVKAYAESFKTQVRAMLQQRTADAMNRPQNMYDDAPDYETVFGNDDDSFTITGDIDGDREALPA